MNLGVKAGQCFLVLIFPLMENITGVFFSWFFFSDCKVMIQEKEKKSLGSYLGGGERG